LETSNGYWIKVNTNGATRGSLGLAACVAIFRNSRGEYIGSFSSFSGVQNVVMLKLWESYMRWNMLGMQILESFGLNVIQLLSV